MRARLTHLGLEGTSLDFSEEERFKLRPEQYVGGVGLVKRKCWEVRGRTIFLQREGHP